jgi:hypothetical protein
VAAIHRNSDRSAPNTTRASPTLQRCILLGGAGEFQALRDDEVASIEAIIRDAVADY